MKQNSQQIPENFEGQVVFNDQGELAHLIECVKYQPVIYPTFWQNLLKKIFRK